MKKFKLSIYSIIIVFILSGCSSIKADISGNKASSTSSTNISKNSNSENIPVHQGKKLPKNASESQDTVKLNTTSGSTESAINTFEYTASNYKEFYAAVYDSLENFNSTQNIKITNYTQGKYNLNVVYDVLKDHFDVDYGIDSVSASIYISDSKDYIMHIEYGYKFSKSYMVSMKTASAAAAYKIVNSIIKEGMTDAEKELAIHDYLVNHTRYDYQNYVKGTLPNEAFTDYGALVLGSAVCSGYSKALYRMLNLAGIQNYIVKGYGDNVLHTWNIVKVDGKFYHVDSTWDDPVWVKDTLTYDYFNLTDTQMAKDHTWNRADYPKCN